jgi:hypothetical protein
LIAFFIMFERKKPVELRKYPEMIDLLPRGTSEFPILFCDEDLEELDGCGMVSWIVT